MKIIRFLILIICFSIIFSFDVFAVQGSNSGSGATTLTSLGDATADATVLTAGWKTIYESSLNTAGAVFSIKNTVADLTADVSLWDCLFNDDGDANTYCLRVYDNAYTDQKAYIKGDGSALFQSLTVPGGVTVAATATGGQYDLRYEATGNGTNYFGWGVYGDLAHSTIYAAPLAAPAAGQVMSCTTPGNQTMSDGSTQSVSVCSWIYPNEVVTASKSSAYTIGTDDIRECYGGHIFVTGNAVITACDGLDPNMSFSVSVIGAYTISLDVQSDDRQVLDGKVLDDGDKATGTGASGDIIACIPDSAAGWDCHSGSTAGTKWTDGGA